MLGRAGAAIGDQQEIIGQAQLQSQELVLLSDAGVAVAVAVEEMTGNRHGP